MVLEEGCDVGRRAVVFGVKVLLKRQVSSVWCTGHVKPAAGGYFTHTRALKRRDPLDKFQGTPSDVEMQDLTSPL